MTDERPMMAGSATVFAVSNVILELLRHCFAGNRDGLRV